VTGLSTLETIVDHRVMLFELEAHPDNRGDLHSIDFQSLPFEPRRMFFVRPSRVGETRGGHAHKTAHQLFVCVSGQIEISIAYDGEKASFCLNRSGMAVYLRPGVWSEQTYLSAEAVLLVLSSESYDPASYSRYPGDPKR